MPSMNNPENWTAFAAILAILLSQFPPIGPWLWGRIRGGQVTLATHDTFGLTHHLGRIYALVHVHIEITASRPVSISRIECTIRRRSNNEANADRKVWRLPANTYFSTTSTSADRAGIFIGTIRLNPGEYWQEVIRCYGSKTFDEEEEVHIIQDKFSSHISQEINRRRSENSQNHSLIEVDESLVAEAQAIAGKHFDLTRGEYDLFLVARDRSGKTIGATRQSFVLYESSITALQAVTDDYLYGFGVSEGPSPFRRPAIEPQLTPTSQGDEARKDYSDLLG